MSSQGTTGFHHVAKILGPVLLHPAHYTSWLSGRLALDPTPTQSPSRYVLENFSEPHRGNFFLDTPTAP